MTNTPLLIDPVEFAKALIRCPSVTPEDHGALDVLHHALAEMGFTCHRQSFAREGLPEVDNLYARLGTTAPNFCYAGHTDVVPPGDETQWQVPPFAPEVKDGQLWGRGASDMKGSIAAFVSALSAFLSSHQPKGSISLLITGDEEGVAINGTKAMLEWLVTQGEKIDHCVVGEPTNPKAMGDMVKVGRRGSCNCVITVKGAQGHVAYPHQADNPLPKLLKLLNAVTATPLDDGYERFQPSNLVLTWITSPPLAENVIPGEAMARFNVRFNPNWTGKTLVAELQKRLQSVGDDIEFEFVHRVSGEAFLTTDTAFTELVAVAIEAETGRRPDLSTSGGTSDARFIRTMAPVAEFGLVGETMHKVDERVDVADIYLLAKIYQRILQDYFSGVLK